MIKFVILIPSIFIIYQSVINYKKKQYYKNMNLVNDFLDEIKNKKYFKDKNIYLNNINLEEIKNKYFKDSILVNSLNNPYSVNSSDNISSNYEIYYYTYKIYIERLEHKEVFYRFYSLINKLFN